MSAQRGPFACILMCTHRGHPVFAGKRATSASYHTIIPSLCVVGGFITLMVCERIPVSTCRVHNSEHLQSCESLIRAACHSRKAMCLRIWQLHTWLRHGYFYNFTRVKNQETRIQYLLSIHHSQEQEGVYTNINKYLST